MLFLYCLYTATNVRLALSMLHLSSITFLDPFGSGTNPAIAVRGPNWFRFIIGVDELAVDRDEKVCLDSMFKLKAIARAKGKAKQRIQLNFTIAAVKLIDEVTKVLIKIFISDFTQQFNIVC